MSDATDALANAAFDYTEAIRAAQSDPTDTIRMLTALLAAPTPAFVEPSAQAAALLAAQVFRRAALASIAMATADYQPVSSTEASAAIATIGNLFDAEILDAADNGQDAGYAALRDMRHAVIADLTARSADLPELITVAIPGMLPSLAMAYRLYGDTLREPGMVARADMIHPGFMPASFEALAS